MSSKLKRRLLKDNLVRRCLTLIDELRIGVSESVILDLLGDIISGCIKMFGRDKVFKTINNRIVTEEKKIDLRKQIKAGICVECGLNPILPKFPICVDCHDYFNKMEIMAEFQVLKSGDVRHH